jgi:hypothetical protein
LSRCIEPCFSPRENPPADAIVLDGAGRIWAGVEQLWRMKRHLPRMTFCNYLRAGDDSDLATLAQRLGAKLDSSMTWAEIDEASLTLEGTVAFKGRAASNGGCRGRSTRHRRNHRFKITVAGNVMLQSRQSTPYLALPNGLRAKYPCSSAAACGAATMSSKRLALG